MFAKTILLIIALTSSKAVSIRAGTTASAAASRVPARPPAPAPRPPTPAPRVDPQIFQDEQGPAKLAKACLGTIMESIPPDFCWKNEGPDGMSVPKEQSCPHGYYSSWLHWNYRSCYSDCNILYKS